MTKKGTIRYICATNIRELCLFGLILLLAFGVNVRSGGSFLTAGNLNAMFVDIAILTILTMGMMSVIITGGIDLSVGSTMALAGMVSTSILRDSIHAQGIGIHPIWVILIAICVGLLAGLVNGILITVLNVMPIITTLGTMSIFRGITHLVSDGRWVLQQDMTTEFLAVATENRLLGINNLIWIALVVFVINFYFLGYSRTGRKIYAIGNSEESAAISGINTKRITALTYIVTGGMAGLAGVLFVARFAAAQSETALGYELFVIAACVLGGVSIAGGTGKVHGAVLGAILFGMLNNALPMLRISPFWQEAIRGLIILGSILINALVVRRANRKVIERRVAA
ncbi:MAG: ABC transporter permease [Lachnospiraceae bacterium]|nr:ABC transporter permease [Lachnospiraceae bacterium]